MNIELSKFAFAEDFYLITQDHDVSLEIDKRFNEEYISQDVIISTMLIQFLGAFCEKYFTKDDFYVQVQSIYNFNDFKLYLTKFYGHLLLKMKLSDSPKQLLEELDYDTFLQSSKFVNRIKNIVQEHVPDPQKVLNLLGYDNEIISLLLNGSEEDYTKIKTLISYDDNFELKDDSLLALCIIANAYIENYNKQIPDNDVLNNPEEMNVWIKLFMVVIQYYLIAKEKYPQDYLEWKNFIIGNFQFSFIENISDISRSNIKEGFAKGLTLLTYQEVYYRNHLNSYFDIIYNKGYSIGYRSSIIKILQNPLYNKPILPYYTEYCKKHDISEEQQIYLGDISQDSLNSEKETDSLSDILSDIDKQVPDNNTNEHFNLALKASWVKKLYDKLINVYISSNTDFELFCYRLIGKGKPNEVTPIAWIANKQSLVLFIHELGLKKFGWKKIGRIFNKNEKEVNNLKVTKTRMFEDNKELSRDPDISVANLKNIFIELFNR